MCAGAVLLSFCLPLRALPRESFCWFYNLTHLPCAGCGLTRSFICISHGDWRQAYEFNPFGFVWYFLALYGFLRPLLLRHLSSRLAFLEKLFKGDAFFPALAGLMFLVWAWRIYTRII
jgi:hypothetical protein